MDPVTFACAILGAVGTSLGIINTVWNWRERKEKVFVYWVHQGLYTLRIYNPTPRPIEIRSRTLEYWNEAKGVWIAVDIPRQIGDPECMLEPFRSEEFIMNANEIVTQFMGKRCRIVVITGRGVKHNILIDKVKSEKDAG
jgi:hypothetical protein